MEGIVFTQQMRQFASHLFEAELEKSKDLIDQFVYSCSHGLRSPIKSMSGLVFLLKQCPKEQTENRELYLDLLGKSISKSQSILEHFEELSQIQNEELFIESISLDSLSRKLKKRFTEQMNFHNISFYRQVQQKSEFFSDKRALQTILIQLISNAISFSNPNEKQKSISLFITCSAGGCCFQVVDNGIGIPAHICEKVFNLFFRGSEKSTGTGMGLYIAKEVTAKMDGTLTVHSPEQGSSFSLWLPNLSLNRDGK
jgi:signal transduction histidine kinase